MKATTTQTPLQKALDEYHEVVKAADQTNSDIIALKQRIIDLDQEIKSNLETTNNAPDLSGMSISKIKEHSDHLLRLEHQISVLKAATNFTLKEIEAKKNANESYRLQLLDIREYCWRMVYDELLKSLDRDLLNQLTIIGLSINKSFVNVAADVLPHEPDYSRFESLRERYGIPV